MGVDCSDARGVPRTCARLCLASSPNVLSGGVAFGTPTVDLYVLQFVSPPCDVQCMASPTSKRVPGGVVHKLPVDLREALLANSTAHAAWMDITPLARNEFICWVEDAKQDVTRQRRIRRTREELEEGQRRPCCWPGCKHRERTGA